MRFSAHSDVADVATGPGQFSSGSAGFGCGLSSWACPVQLPFPWHFLAKMFSYITFPFFFFNMLIQFAATLEPGPVLAVAPSELLQP